MEAHTNIKVILVDDDESIRNLYIFHLQNCFKNITIIEKSSGNDCISYLDESPDHQKINLIISDFVMPNGTGGDLYQHIQQKNYRIPFLLFCSKDLEDLEQFSQFRNSLKGNTYLKKPSPPSMFLGTVKNIFKEILPNQNIVAQEFEYKKIHMTRLLKGNKTLCNIYIQAGPLKYIKIINKEDSYKQEFVLANIDKKIDFFYIHELDYEKFKDNFIDLPFLQCQDMNIDEIERARQFFISDILKNVGITRTVISEVEKTIQTIQDDCSKKNSSLKKYLSIFSRESSFQSDHCTLLSMFSTAIGREMEWYSEDIIQKLCYASIFHDGALEDPILEKHYMAGGMKFILGNFKESTIAQFIGHPQKMASIVSKLNQIPPDIDTIISQHHEGPDGSGFPRGLNAKSISPLAALFIVAHEFISQLYLHNFEFNQMDSILEKLLKKFDYDRFREPVYGLKKIIQKNKIMPEEK